MPLQRSLRLPLPYSANKHIRSEATDYERIPTTNNTMQICCGASFKKLCFNNSKQQTFTIKYNQREIAEKNFFKGALFKRCKS